jgi:hypothetical protein
MTAPSDDLRQKDEPWLTAESLAPVAPAAVTPESVEQLSVAPASVTWASESKPETTIALALKPILQGLPPFQLGGDPASVPAETQIDLPFSLIEPQLASGRITLTPAVFEAALPQ